MSKRLSILLLPALLACSLDPGKEPWTPDSKPAATDMAPAPRAACESRDPLRRPLFGDLHVHTGFSMDAWVQGVRVTPDDAYRFARGEPIGLPPHGADGSPSGTMQLERPLDFAAVTDHGEWLGEVRICQDELSPAYDSRSCRIFRGEQPSWLGRILGLRGFRQQLAGAVSLSGRNEEICGEDSARCREETLTAWRLNQEATERWYDRTPACSFTTLHGYEYSRSPASTKIHRNVIFRNEVVPELPISWIDTPTELEFWRKLRSQCLDVDSACDALAIPHNPNLSNGQLFQVPYRDLPIEEQRAQAKLRAGLEPVVEMVQYKGESECRNGLYGVLGGPDELCDFGKVRDLPGLPLEDCEEGTGSGAQRGRGCISRLDYVRYALIEGLREEERIGVNPYVFGFIGSTDTHLGNPGAVEESSALPSFSSDTTKLLHVGESRRPVPFRSAGGLAGVWAEENTRDAIFDALARREVFATSGTRIAPRLFAGKGLPEDWCSQGDRVARGYAEGVPMGGRVETKAGAGSAVRFAVHARRDPRSAALERIQIVKGWHGEDGGFHQQVSDVVRNPDAPAEAAEDCRIEPAGGDSLCATWVDPSFDPAQAAVYYARVIEAPTCRWTRWRCQALPEGERPDACSDPRVPTTIQERAWTSPIWVAPEPPPSTALD